VIAAGAVSAGDDRAAVTVRLADVKGIARVNVKLRRNQLMKVALLLLQVNSTSV